MIDELHTLATAVGTWRPEIAALSDSGITNAENEA
jgi:hypothetical protein